MELLYPVFKFIVRLELVIFCRHIFIDKRKYLKSKGPLLLAFNHPNSFLDAIIIDLMFEQPIWSLARGDAFKGKTIKKILHGFKILPVFRNTEGAENLSENYKTFNECIAIFKENGLVQIFSEGRCVNEWHLRPLKKGTARLAFKAWEEKIPLTVLPLGINYSSFTRFGKNVFIHFGEPITANDINIDAADGIRNQTFNNLLRGQLEKLIYEIPKDDRKQQEAKLVVKPSVIDWVLFSIPAIIGLILNAPLYLPIKNFVAKKTRGTGHHDSVMLGLLLITYPFYLLILVLTAWLIFRTGWVWLLLVIAPVSAWCLVRLKGQLDPIK